MMLPVDLEKLMSGFMIALFALGSITFIAGIVILGLCAASKDIRNITAQASQLAQKGLAEDVSGLVGNISNLVLGLNQLIRTRAGIGVFLTLLGLLMMAGASIFAIQINRIYR